MKTEKALSIDPRLKDAYEVASASLCNQKRYDEAVELLTKAIAVLPNEKSLFGERAFAYWNNAVVYGKEYLYAKALSDLNRVIEFDPQSAGAYYWRGRCKYIVYGAGSDENDLKRAEELGYNYRGWI